MERAYVSLGSNLGDRYENINSAIRLIKKHGIDVNSISRFYVTEPWGKKDQNEFLNCVIEIETDKNPWDLLGVFQSIEQKLGKNIKVRWGERTIDLDIVLYGQKVIYEKKIIIPHPRYHKRNFVLIPLCDISKEIYDPFHKMDSGGLLLQVKDENIVKLFNED